MATVCCESCGINHRRENSFMVFIKATASIYFQSDHGPAYLCGKCGLVEFRKGKTSVYYFSEYYKAKARRYEIRMKALEVSDGKTKA